MYGAGGDSEDEGLYGWTATAAGSDAYDAGDLLAPALDNERVGLVLV